MLLMSTGAFQFLSKHLLVNDARYVCDADGTFCYTSLGELTDFPAGHMAANVAINTVGFILFAA